MSDETPQEWFGGIPVTGSRPLTPAERSGIVWLRREALQQLWKAAAIFVVVTALAVAASIGDGSPALLWLLIAVLAIRHGGIANRYIALSRFVRDVKRDLDAGAMVICSDDDVRLEVLPASHLLWSRNGVREDGLLLLSRGETAALPEHARMAARYLRPWDETTSVHQRPLTEAEHAELAGYVPPFPLARVAAVVVLLLAIGMAVPYALRADAKLLFLILIPAAAVWLLGRSALGAIRWRAGLRADLAERIAVIVRTESDQRLREVLPHASLLWSEDGAPAAWRRGG